MARAVASNNAIGRFQDETVVSPEESAFFHTGEIFGADLIFHLKVVNLHSSLLPLPMLSTLFSHGESQSFASSNHWLKNLTHHPSPKSQNKTKKFGANFFCPIIPTHSQIDVYLFIPQLL
jgi:hypothetical protein